MGGGAGDKDARRCSLARRPGCIVLFAVFGSVTGIVIYLLDNEPLPLFYSHIDSIWPEPSAGRSALFDRIGVQLLLFAGFKLHDRGCIRSTDPPNLCERVLHQITPSWKQPPG